MKKSDLPWHRKAPVASISGDRFAAIGRACCGSKNEKGAIIERGAKSWQAPYAEALGITTEWVRRCAKMDLVTGEPASRAKHLESLLPEERKRWLRKLRRGGAAEFAAKR